jgi:predicted nucleic acid-binding Zn ribbon protein
MKKPRNTNEQSIKDVISELFASNKMDTKLKEIKIINSWEKLVGNLIAKNTEKIYFSGGKLFLQVTSAPLRTELTYSKRKLIEVVNTEAGEKLIDDVVIR